MLVCNQIVVNNAKGKVFSDIDSIKCNKVGLLLGTTPQARFDRITNYKMPQGQVPDMLKKSKVKCHRDRYLTCRRSLK